RRPGEEKSGQAQIDSHGPRHSVETADQDQHGNGCREINEQSADHQEWLRQKRQQSEERNRKGRIERSRRRLVLERAVKPVPAGVVEKLEVASLPGGGDDSVSQGSQSEPEERDMVDGQAPPPVRAGFSRGSHLVCLQRLSSQELKPV